MRRRFLAVVFVVAALASCGVDGDGDGDERGVVPVEETLPTVQGRTLDGKSVSTADLVGAPAVVNVWATWCAPCEAELPELVDVASRYDGRVRFLGVYFTDDAARGRAWEDDYGLRYPSIDDEDGELADDLGFPYLPHTLVVDANGTIRYRIFGQTTADELSGLLDALLAEPGAR